MYIYRCIITCTVIQTASMPSCTCFWWDCIHGITSVVAAITVTSVVAAITASGTLNVDMMHTS